MESLDVFLYNNLIGTLTLLSGAQILFTFEEKYINDQQKKTLN